MKVDILAIGAHPDDVELSAGVSLIKQIHLGKTVAIVDLTKGELGTRGTAETRLQESAKAAEIMGVLVRENLEMADGFFVHDEAHLRKVITVIRK